MSPSQAVEAGSSSTSMELIRLEDFWNLKSVNDPRVSPDGRKVAFTVGSLDERTNKAHSAIWLLDLPSGECRRLTNGHYADSAPRWSPDGSCLAFVSTRGDGKPQIFILPLAGGEPASVTNLADGATNPVWSPDGARICFCSAPETNRQSVDAEAKWFDTHPDADQKAPRMRHITGLMSRFDGRGYIDRRSHLFLIDVEPPDPSPMQLTEGDFDDSEAAWSPDGALIAFISNRTPDRERNFASDVWTVSAHDKSLQRLTDGSLTAASPSWSPDGQTVAFYAEPEWITHGYRETHVWLVSRDGGDQKDISAGLDRPVSFAGTDYMTPIASPPAWSLDGRSVFFVAADGAANRVFQAVVGRKLLKPVTGDQLQVASVQPLPGGKDLLGLALTATTPAEIYRIRLDGEPVPLTRINEVVMSKLKLTPPERVRFEGPDGWPIEGWLARPLQSAGPHPLILHVHGGPQGRYSDTFYLFVHMLAAQGYASLYINPRGSTGYGFEFAKAADWGEKDYLDLMAGVDAVVSRPEIDGERLGVTGVSYGGFMTNWILGHSNRFRAGVSINGIASAFSMYGSSDVTALWFESEYGGPFWRSEEQWRRYRDHSPVTFVENIMAPLLLLQCENDFRCPIPEGEMMLTALRILGRTVEMVRIPGASHVLASSGTPHQRYLRWKLTLDWFDRYVADRQAGGRPGS